MSERRSSDSERNEQHAVAPLRIPLPIQSFLWRQTEPFLRRKIGKLYEASCMSFEHVLVENKLQGLPPSLSGAIESITRGQLIDACLPHVMHCAALLISNRNKLGQADKFGVPATKLLHTLHWIFIDFGSACEGAETRDSEDNCISFENIQLFVYLFPPILNCLKDTDLTFRLASGQKIWKPLWNHEQPDVAAFKAPISIDKSRDPTITVTLAPNSPSTSSVEHASNKPQKLTLFDAAVLDCLLHQRWSEDGVLWGVTYLLKKVQKSTSMKGHQFIGQSAHRRCQSLINRKPELRLGMKRSITILSAQKEVPYKQEESEPFDQTPLSFTKKPNFSTTDKRALNSFSKRSLIKSSATKRRKNSNVKKRKFSSTSLRRISISAFTSKFSSQTDLNDSTEDNPPSYGSVSLLSGSSVLPKQRFQFRRRTFAVNPRPRPETTSVDQPPSYSQAQNIPDGTSSQFSGTKISGGIKSSSAGNRFLKALNLPVKNWISESCLNQRTPKPGSKLSHSNYASSDGSISVDVILSVLCLVVERNLGLRLMDICLQIIECLFQMHTFTSAGEGLSTKLAKLLRVLHGFTCHLGCTNGCTRSGNRSTTSNKMRATTRLMLTNIFSMERDAFCNYLKSVIDNQPLADTMDFLHPLLVYCTIDINSCDVRELNDEVLCANASANTQLEDVVIKTIFRGLVNKCVEMDKKMYNNQNKNLYEEVRHLVQFVRIRHPSAFNRVLLSVMSVPMKKRQQWLKDQEPKNVKQPAPSETTTPRSTRAMRRGGVDLASSPLFAKRFEKRGSNKPSNIFRLSMEFLDRTSLSSSQHIQGNSLSGTTTPKLLSAHELSSDEDDFGRSFDNDRRRFNKIGSIFKTKNQNKIPFGAENEEDLNTTFFSRMIKKKISKRTEKDEEFECDVIKSPQYSRNAKSGGIDKTSEFLVDESDIKNGSRILYFLMDCCPPGTVPEPSVIASLMGLESPVVSRATVFLLCANFVENCSNGAWPHWMQQRIFHSKRCHKNAKFYTKTAKLFLQWGEAVSEFLEKVLAICNDPKTVLGDIRDKDEQLRNYEEDLKENFLYDMRVNDSGKKCPTALSLAAVDLLYQITVFLRDVFPRLPHEEYLQAKAQALDHTTGMIVVPQIKHSESSWRKTIKFSSQLDQQTNSVTDTSARSGILQDSLSAGQRTSKAEGSEFGGKSCTGGCPLSTPSSGNTLTVPTNSLYLGGNFSPFSSCSRLSFGSTASLGASSVQSDPRDSNLSNVRSPSPSTKPESTSMDSLSWLKVMLAFANQQNFLCNHIDFCHPFCHQRITRSCNRLVNAIFEAVTNQEAEEIVRTPEARQEKSPTTSFSMYLKSRASILTKMPLSTLLKAVTLLPDSLLVDTQALCWEIMLDGSKCMTKIAASLFLLSSFRIPDDVHTCIMVDLCHSNPTHRVRALRKLRVLWDCRYDTWKNTELKARHAYKFNVPSASFTLSATDLGLETPVIPDPPWVPNIINIDEILAQNSSSAQGAAFLATDTLSHYKEQQLKKLLQREKEQRSIARSKFHLTDVPITQTILAEARKKVNTDEFEEEATCPSRRLSSRLPSVGSNNLSSESKKEEWKRHSRTRINNLEGSQENICRLDPISTFPNSPAYPPCIAACLPVVLQCTSDVYTTKENQSVGDIARNLVTTCMGEDTSLFLRCILEKMTDKSEQFHSLWILRRLPNMLQDISPSIAHVLLSHLIEGILHYNRLATTNEELIAASLMAITALVPSAQAIDLKTIKLALRKEQIDTQVLITAGIPGAKKLTVWNQGDYYMPTQIEVTDLSTFDTVLREALISIDIPESDHNKYQLFDRQKNQILCRHCYVRDFYQFRKAVYPELNLVEMEEEEGTKLMTDRVVALKLAEIARLRFIISALCHQKNPVDQQLNATFIQDELNKLWSFPRKAMDAEFFMFDTKHGDVIRQLDVVQKFYWMDFIVELFLSLSKDFPWEDDLLCFMHVLCAGLVVHCEEPPLLRRFCAAVIDVVVHLAHTFTLPGYSLVLPSILCIYSKHHHNDLIRSCLELVFKQMFKVHRQPFILQLFANAAPLLSEFNWLKLSGEKDPIDQLSPDVFFRLLLSLQTPEEVDKLQVMSLVKAEKPLKPVDECLSEMENITFGDYFRLCITVIAYQPETSRTLEMLVVINSILPCYLDYMQTNMSPTEEFIQLNDMSINIRSLLSSVEVLTRTIISASQQHNDQTQAQHARSARDLGIIEEGLNIQDSSDGAQTIEEFVAPRDVILQLCTTFFTHTRARMQMLKPSHSDEFLSVKSHNRLAEIAHSLLKILTDESVPTVSLGLAYYIKRMLPVVDWSIEAVRPALFLVLKRLDRFFGKLSKVYSFRRKLDKRTVSMMVSGLCDLLARQPSVSHIPHLKTFVNMCATMQVGTNVPANGEDALNCECKTRLNISPTLTPNVVKLIVLQARSLGDGFTVQDIIKPLIESEVKINLLLNLIIPICLCVAGETPILPHANDSDGKMKWKLELPKSDVVFMMNLCIDALTGKLSRSRHNMAELFLATSPMTKKKNVAVCQVALLTLRVVIACFHRQLQGEWYGLAQKIKNIACKNADGSYIWSFMIFVMKYKTPLVLHLKPFVVRQFMRRRFTEEALKRQLQNCLETKSCVPIVMTLLIKDFVREAQELRHLSQQPKAVKSPTILKVPSNVASKLSSLDQNSYKERSRLSSFRCAITSLPKTQTQTQHESVEETPLETDKLIVKQAERSATPSRSPPAVRLWTQLMRSSKSNRDDIDHETSGKTSRCSLSTLQTKDKASTSKSSNIPNITVGMYVTPRKSSNKIRQDTWSDVGDSKQTIEPSADDIQTSPKLTTKPKKTPGNQHLSPNMSLDEGGAISGRRDSVSAVKEDRKSYSTLTIDEEPIDQPSSSVTQHDEAKRALQKLALKSSFRR